MYRDSPGRTLSNPQEEVLHSFCKHMLKSRLFKGFYKERHYVEIINGYRDLIILNRNESELRVVLEDIRNRLIQFYQNETPQMWVGITTASDSLAEIPGIVNQTCVWTEIDELALGQYWFSIKTVRFRENEIIIKLKPVRAVEKESDDTSSTPMFAEVKTETASIHLEHFLKIMTDWGSSIKLSVYEFMSNDISKENIKGVLKFVFLMVISLITVSYEAVKFIGIYSIQFMAEFRKLLIALTPIIMRIIDLCGKIVGGFYILLAMLWRDTVGNRGPKMNPPRAIAYDNPANLSIAYGNSNSATQNKKRSRNAHEPNFCNKFET